MDPKWERLIEPGLRYQFDLAVAGIGSDELLVQQPQAGEELPASAGSQPGVLPGKRPVLDMTVGRSRPFTAEDYRTPTDAEIDASIASLATDPQFSGAVEYKRVS